MAGSVSGCSVARVDKMMLCVIARVDQQKLMYSKMSASSQAG
jgi:hypothetical protein